MQSVLKFVHASMIFPFLSRLLFAITIAYFLPCTAKSFPWIRTTLIFMIHKCIYDMYKHYILGTFRACHARSRIISINCVPCIVIISTSDVKYQKYFKLFPTILNLVFLSQHKNDGGLLSFMISWQGKQRSRFII